MMLALFLLPQALPAPTSVGTEWLTVAAFVLPFLLLVAILAAGRRRI